jgi:integrase
MKLACDYLVGRLAQRVLGHASIAITKDVYGHLLEGDKRAAAESMSRALFGS